MLSDQKILLAGLPDDERRTIESALIRSGFNTEHIYWGENLPDEVFACVIVDLGRSEYREASQLLKNPALSQASCITLLDQKNAHARLIAMTMGTDDIIYKPVHLRELIAKVSILIDKYLDRNLGTSTYLEDDIDLLQRLQDYASHGVTGSISFTGNGFCTVISFENGMIVGVQNGRKTGMTAITSVWRTLPGQVEFLGNHVTRDLDVPFDTSKAIAQIADTVQTWQSISSPAPGLNTICNINWAIYGEHEAGLPRQVRRIAQLFDGNRSLGEILDAVALDDRLLIKILAKLAQDGILKAQNAVVKEVPLDAWVKQNLKSDEMRSKPAMTSLQRQEEVTPRIQIEVPAPVASRVAEQAQLNANSRSYEDEAYDEEEDEYDEAYDEEEDEYDEEEYADNEYAGEGFAENEPTPSVILYAGDLDKSAAEASARFERLAAAESPEEKLEQTIIEMCKSGDLAQLEPIENIPVDPEALEEHIAALPEAKTRTMTVREDVQCRDDDEAEAYSYQNQVNSPKIDSQHVIVSMGSVPILKTVAQDVQNAEVNALNKSSFDESANKLDNLPTPREAKEDEEFEEDEETELDEETEDEENVDGTSEHDSGEYDDEEDDEEEDSDDEEKYDFDKTRGILDAFSRINPSNDPKSSYSEKYSHGNRVVEASSYTRGDKANTLRSIGNVERGNTDVMRGKVLDDEDDDHLYEDGEGGAGEEREGLGSEPEVIKKEEKPKRSVPKFPTPEEWEELKLQSIKEASLRKQRKISMVLLVIIVILLIFFLWLFLRHPKPTATQGVKADTPVEAPVEAEK